MQEREERGEAAPSGEVALAKRKRALARAARGPKRSTIAPVLPAAWLRRKPYRTAHGGSASEVVEEGGAGVGEEDGREVVHVTGQDKLGGPADAPRGPWKTERP